MKYYLVKTICKATDINPNFKGSVETYLHGKENFCFKRSATGSICNSFLPEYDSICKYNLREYGYKSEAMAKRCCSYTHPENSKYWTSEVSIECIEV